MLEAYENIDRLLTVELRTRGMPRGIVPHLYRLSRGREPTSYRAAKALAGNGGKRVAIVTGIHFSPHFPAGEVDGPVGAVVLARALASLGIRVDVLVEEPVVPPVEAMRSWTGGAFEIANTTRLTQKAVDGLAATYDAAVTVEKLGVNALGVRHSILGTALPPESPPLDPFIDAMNTARKLTVGIGDGGNEMGFGAIFDQARQVVPWGAECRCPCKGGIVTRTSTQILLPALVSNFGAYGIVAALSIHCGSPGLLPTGSEIVGLLDVGVANGLVDGAFVKPGLVSDDGIPAAGVAAWVDTLGTIVSQEAVLIDRSF
jgi:hypothetical protein